MRLLFPSGNENVEYLSQDTCHDLALEELIDMMAVLDTDKAILRKVLTQIPSDKENVQLRQDILKDFIDDAEFCSKMDMILRKINILKEFRDNGHFLREKKASLRELIDYMQEMDVYIQIIEELNVLFANYNPKSKGLNDVAKLISRVVDSDRISDLKAVVNKLKADMSTLRSMTVGINLSADLTPEEIIIIGYNQFPFKSQFEKTAKGLSIAAQRLIKYKEPSHFMKYICEDVEKRMGNMFKDSKKKLREFINLDGYFLLDICDDLRFFILAANYARELSGNGQSICFPAIDNAADKVAIKGVYNLRLTKKELDEIVKNDFVFAENEKLFIITGPNRGGKTMLTQAVGVAALLAMQGLFVPADAYEGYIFEDILTHFPADENSTLDLGRLGEEAERIQQIVKAATSRTLVLLNETYSSTSAYDGLYLAKDLMHALKYKNVPVMYNTHIHELARAIDEMNKWEGNSNIVSLTMEIIDNVNTFRVLRKEPDRSSFARNIALKYGVTFEQMIEAGE